MLRASPGEPTGLRNKTRDVASLAEVFSAVSLLDFHTEKFQLRGIDFPKKTFRVKASAKNFQKRFSFRRRRKNQFSRQGGTDLVAKHFETAPAPLALQIR